MKNVDYEQLYYDQLYENKKMINEISKLKEEIFVYKELLKNKPIKQILAVNILEYLKKERNNYERK